MAPMAPPVRRTSLFEDIHHAMARGDETQLRALFDLARYSESDSFEFHLVQGLIHLRQSRQREAYISLCAAINIDDKNSETFALCARAISLYSTSFAVRFLAQALARDPAAASLWIEYWRLTRGEEPGDRLATILRRLPLALNREEKACLLNEIGHIPAHPRYVGVVESDVDARRLNIWAHDFADDGGKFQLQVRTDRGTHTLEPRRTDYLTCDKKSFRIQYFEKKIDGDRQQSELFFPDGSALTQRPIKKQSKLSSPPTAKKSSQIIDVIIPVYGSLSQTLRCLKSVAAAEKYNRRRHCVIIIDDASPAPDFVERLRIVCAKYGFIYRRNPCNLGFIASVNAGFGLHKSRDVILLNSDTIVHGDWIDRLSAASSETAKVASVTPLSNYGELMSFPVMKVLNDFPGSKVAATLDRILRRIDMGPLTIPSGCGFCMYFNRSALEEIGGFNDVHLTRGYGEETDWCLRADERGWVHLGAMNIYVAHEGGRSFGVEKYGLALKNNRFIENKFPNAISRHDAWLDNAQVKEAFNALKLELLSRILVIAEKNRSKIILHLSHELPGDPEENSLTISIGVKNGETSADFIIREIGAVQQYIVKDVTDIARLIRQISDHSTRKPYLTHKMRDFLFDNHPGVKKFHTLRLKKPRILFRPEVLCGEENGPLLIADQIDDPYIGGRWKKLLRAAFSATCRYRFLLTEITSWREELIKSSNVIEAPPPLKTPLSDHLKLSGCRYALSLEDRADVLRQNYWRPARFAKRADVALISASTLENIAMDHLPELFQQELLQIIKEAS